MRDLDVLAKEANECHALAQGVLARWIDHAVAAGRILVEARDRVEEEGGAWGQWCKDNLEFTISTARYYRVVHLHEDRLRAEGLTDCLPIMSFVTRHRLGVGKPQGRPETSTPELRAYVRQRRRAGHSWRTIGEELGHTPDTVRAWVDPAHRKVVRQRTIFYQKKYKAAAEALRREESSTWVKQHRGDLAKTYGSVRQLAQTFNRLGMGEAEGLAHRLEDMIVAKLREERVSA